MFGWGEVVKNVGEAADSLFTSDEERLKAGLDELKVHAGLDKGQMEVNAVEAKHSSIFVAGWRPAIGWIGAAAMAYQFILYPILIWIWALLQANGIVAAELTPPPVLDSGALFSIITGMLGLGAMRSHDKKHGVDSKRIGN